MSIQRGQNEMATPAGFEPATFSLEDEYPAICCNRRQFPATANSLTRRENLSQEVASSCGQLQPSAC